MDDSARFALSSDVVTREIDGGALLVNLGSGATWRLNGVGAAICRRLDGEASLAEVVAGILADFAPAPGLDADVVRRDVEALVADLRAQGLVEAIP